MPDRVRTIAYLDNSSDFSGGQKSLLALLSRLDRKKYRPIAIIDKQATRFREELAKIDVECIQIDYANESGVFEKAMVPFVIARLWRTLRRAKCQLIHANTFKVGFLAAILRKALGAPVIFRSRLGIVVNSHGWIDKVIYQHVDLVLANSHYVKSTYAQRFNDDQKVEVVYNPLFPRYDLNSEEVEKLRKRFFQEPRFVFGTIGRIEPFKRQQEIVDAAVLLAARRKDFRVLIIGDVPVAGGDAYKGQLTRKIEAHGLQEFFTFTGFVTSIFEMTSLLNCVLLCTEGEPLSRGIFESQYLGVPVIASDSGGNSELIRHGETGYLYKLGNPADLADKMELIMNAGSQIEYITTNAFKFVSDTFRPENTNKLEEAIYDRILNRFYPKVLNQ